MMQTGWETRGGSLVRAGCQEELWSKVEKLEGEVRELRTDNKKLREQNEILAGKAGKLAEENKGLREEIRRIKRQPKRPKIGPTKLEPKKKKQRGTGRRKKKGAMGYDETKIVKAKDVPEGSRFKGYADYYVQELEIRTVRTRYRKERWQTPDGRMLIAALDSHSATGHYGPTLRSFVLYQYYHAQVTEPLLLEQLREWGMQLSSGQLHLMITSGKDKFHQEKDEILKTGLRVSRHIHVDDTGARHQGKIGYCTHIGNAWFAWFKSTSRKSRINFLELLRAGATDYLLSADALDYMARYKLKKSLLDKLSSAETKHFADKAAWETFLRRSDITTKRHVRMVTEAALLGAVLSHDINPDLAIVSDDAGQFKILIQGLCWIHAERSIAKIVGISESQKEEIQHIRGLIWSLYRDIQVYQKNPSDPVKIDIERRFDELCDKNNLASPTVGPELSRFKKNKTQLLLALVRPDIPLHNNLSESDIREFVKRRKISGGTRADHGRRGRDTFASLKKTARKLGISFWCFLIDRIRNDHRIKPLHLLLEARALSP